MRGLGKNLSHVEYIGGRQQDVTLTVSWWGRNTVMLRANRGERGLVTGCATCLVSALDADERGMRFERRVVEENGVSEGGE